MALDRNDRMYRVCYGCCESGGGNASINLRLRQLIYAAELRDSQPDANVRGIIGHLNRKSWIVPVRGTRLGIVVGEIRGSGIAVPLN